MNSSTMKIFLSLLVSMALMSAVWGWTSIELTDNSVDHPGHCFSKNEKVGAMKRGEVKQLIGECVRVSCAEDTSIDYAGCGVVDAGKGCRVTAGDLSKPYPDCCPDVECS